MLSVRDSFLELQGTVQNASMYFDAWWELSDAGNPAHGRYRDAMSPYHLYFTAAADAQLLATIVLLYQFLEVRKDTQNFGALLSRVEEEEGFNALQLVMSLRTEADDLHLVWKKIARIRSTVMAHLSHTGNSADLMARADLTPNEIGSFIQKAQALMKRLSEHYGILGEALLHPNVKAHTRKLMRDLGSVQSSGSARD